MMLRSFVQFAAFVGSLVLAALGLLVLALVPVPVSLVLAPGALLLAGGLWLWMCEDIREEIAERS